jgi:hypothetical protein
MCLLLLYYVLLLLYVCTILHALCSVLHQYMFHYCIMLQNHTITKLCSFKTKQIQHFIKYFENIQIIVSS